MRQDGVVWARGPEGGDAHRHFFGQLRAFERLRKWPYANQRRAHARRRQLELLADAEGAHALSCKERALMALVRGLLVARRVDDSYAGVRVRLASLRLLSALHRPSAPESTTRTSVRRPSCSTAHNPCRSGVSGAGEPMRYVALCGAN